MNEPRIWSHITDQLPEGHSLAHDGVYCLVCREMVHAFNNECMQTWVETGAGNYCLKDWIAELLAAGEYALSVLDEAWGLP